MWQGPIRDELAREMMVGELGPFSSPACMLQDLETKVLRSLGLSELEYLFLQTFYYLTR